MVYRVISHFYRFFLHFFTFFCCFLTWFFRSLRTCELVKFLKRVYGFCGAGRPAGDWTHGTGRGPVGARRAPIKGVINCKGGVIIMVDQNFFYRIIAWGNNCRGLGSKSDPPVPFSHEFWIFLCNFCAKKTRFSRETRVFVYSVLLKTKSIIYPPIGAEKSSAWALAPTIFSHVPCAPRKKK